MRGLRSGAGALWLAAALGALGGCGGGPVLDIEAVSIPMPGTTSLQALVVLNRVPALESDTPVVPIPTGKAGYSFGIQLPEGSTGKVAVGVGAFDKAGCLLAVGSDDETTLDLANAQVALLQRPKAAACGVKKPLLLVAAATSTSALTGGGKLTLFGWGFHPKATLSVNGKQLQPPNDLRWLSPVKLGVTVPATERLVGVPVDFVVQNPDQSQDENKTLFTFTP